jgi:Sec-independent protein translocase protein TatA
MAIFRPCYNQGQTVAQLQADKGNFTLSPEAKRILKIAAIITFVVAALIGTALGVHYGLMTADGASGWNQASQWMLQATPGTHLHNYIWLILTGGILTGALGVKLGPKAFNAAAGGMKRFMNYVADYRTKKSQQEQARREDPYVKEKEDAKKAEQQNQGSSDEGTGVGGLRESVADTKGTMVKEGEKVKAEDMGFAEDPLNTDSKKRADDTATPHNFGSDSDDE